MSNDRSSCPSPVSPLLIVISGPSGVGKDATLARMKEAGLSFHYVVTATTRPRRPGERDGVDYHFLSQDEFDRRKSERQFLEWARVYDNYYGVPKGEVMEALISGQDVIVKVDVQGANTIKGILPEALLIFLMPPSTEELVNRLKQRHGQLVAGLNSRLDKAQEEIETLPLFDYVVTSYKDRLDRTIAEINAILTAEKCRVRPRLIRL